MEPVEVALEKAAEDKGIRSKYKESLTESEPAASPRLPSSPPPLPPPRFYIPEKLLPRALSALQDEDLEQFRRKLCNFSPSLRISQAQVEAADVAELRDLLLCNYGWADAFEKADRALTKIGVKHRSKWLTSSTQGLWISSWLGYALESLDRDDLERFKRKLCGPLSFSITVLEEEVKIIKDVPQLCRLMLRKFGWFGALRMTGVVLELINGKDEVDWLRIAEKRSQDPQIFLQHALQTLEKGDLQKFKKSLLHFCEQKDSDSAFKGMVEGERRVKLFEGLEPVDAGELSNSLISCYGRVEALEIAANVLETINQERPAGWLRLCLEAPDPWECLEDALVSLGKKELQELKHYFFPSFLYAHWTKIEADVSNLCHFLRKLCGDFVALDVASEILEAIGQKHQADWLRLGMAGFKLQNCLDYVLQHLGQEKRETFKDKLCDHWRKVESGLLPTWEANRTKTLEFFDLLEQSHASEFSRKLIKFYGVKDTLDMVIKVLDAMNEQCEADLLKSLMEEHDTWRCLEDAFSNLGEENLERFRCKVLQLSENKGLPSIPKTWMKGTTIPQLIRVMFSFYGQGAALEMVREALKTMADRVSSSTMTDLYQYLVQIHDSVASSFESLVPEEEMSGKMKSPADLGKNCLCKRCPPEVLLSFFLDMHWNGNLTEPGVVRSSQTERKVYELCCTEAGSFHCRYTGLIFEVTKSVTIKYYPDSWKKQQDLWDIQKLVIAGPLFYLEDLPLDAVSAIHLPHFLCLAGEDTSQVQIASLLPKGIHLEKPDSVGPFHAVLTNPRFLSGFFGVVFSKSGFNQTIKAHAMVLLYQIFDTSLFKFHIYLLPTDYSIKKSVHDREVEHHSWRVKKPLWTLKPLTTGSHYFLQELAGVHISPKELNFKYVDSELEQQYFELSTKQMPDTLELKVMEEAEDAPVWEVCVGQDELIPPLHSKKGLEETPVQILGGAEPQLQSPGPSEKERSEKMENRGGFGDKFICNMCPSENLPERDRPEVICHPKTNREMYKLCCTGAGSFHCYYTDLIFEVKGAVTITYQFSSWKKHRNVMDTMKLMIAGPLLDIEADPKEAVAAVHFPHFLCLEDEDRSQVYIAHFVGEGISLEKPKSVRAFHAVLENPQFSEWVVTFKNVFGIKLHTMVLLYQVLGSKTPKFHLYLLPNDSSLRKNVEDYEAKNWRIDKPPSTLSSLKIGSQVIVPSLDHVTIWPEELKFKYIDADKIQQYIELCSEKVQDKLELCLLKKKKKKLIWKAFVRQDELKDSTSQSEQAQEDKLRGSHSRINPDPVHFQSERTHQQSDKLLSFIIKVYLKSAIGVHSGEQSAKI